MLLAFVASLSSESNLDACGSGSHSWYLSSYQGDCDSTCVLVLSALRMEVCGKGKQGEVPRSHH